MSAKTIMLSAMALIASVTTAHAQAAPPAAPGNNIDDRLRQRRTGGIGHGAAGAGGGVGVIGGERLERSEIFRLGQLGTCCLLATGLDAPENDGTDGGDDQEHRKHGDSLLIAVEKCFKGIWLLGNFREGNVGFLRINRHDWRGAKLRRPIKAAMASKSMQKSGSFTIFEFFTIW